MKVRELIKALKKMPENADIVVGNEIGEYDAKHLHAICADSEYGDYGECYYNTVVLCCMSTVIDYEELIDDSISYSIYGDTNWYNTIDTIDVYDENNKKHLLRFDEESKEFKDVEGF